MVMFLQSGGADSDAMAQMLLKYNHLQGLIDEQIRRVRVSLRWLRTVQYWLTPTDLLLYLAYLGCLLKHLPVSYEQVRHKV